MIGAASAKAGVDIGDVLVRIVRTRFHMPRRLSSRALCWLGMQGSRAVEPPHTACIDMIRTAKRPLDITFSRLGGKPPMNTAKHDVLLLEDFVRELRTALALAASRESKLKADVAMQAGEISSLESWKSVQQALSWWRY